ncbi:PrsW family intramembrane metalloprotease [Oscillatoria sp. FACHB-1407]|uniref:PrsW family intramembrane metalloprotease n=1 Tax=Oscillatoria sp. FACHB-1407 TaxID=2692847 RepID=UPI0016846507|nr:PrsW family glutamic-type intramembrane protease [Oscillatoria sp. FACHB-1407]MBD2461785.1 PrsW family intramembrane metalloprotease [Oscillatoria sp. FACHB-1407]
MNVFVVITLAIAPGLFWLWFFYKKDALEPEPRHLIVKTFFWGVFLAIPVLIVQIPFLMISSSMIFLAVIVAPITEEFGKYLVVRWGVYKNIEFDEPVDGIIYAAAAALGFASIENVFYLLGSYYAPQEITEGASASYAVLTLFVIRGLLSVPGHALWASLWGYALGVAKFSTPERASTLIRNGLLLSMFSHGLFNGLLVIFPPLALGVLVLIPLGWRMTFRRIAAALAASPHALKSLSDRQDI